MLVVLTIVGLVTAALPAVLSTGLPGLRLKSEARELVDELRSANRLALTSRKEIVLTVDAENGRYSLTSAAKSTTLAAGIALKFSNTPFAETKGPIAHIRFFPDGSSTGGSIGLVLKGQQYWIDVDWLTGRVVVP